MSLSLNNNAVCTPPIVSHELRGTFDFALTESLYLAFEDASSWPAFMRGLGASLGSSSAALISLADIDRTGIAMTEGLPPQAAQRWQAYFRKIDPWFKQVTMPGPGEHVVFAGSELVSDATVRQGEFHDDFLEPNNLRWLLGAWIRPKAPRASAYGLLLWRGREQADFGAQEQIAFGQIVRMLTVFESFSIANTLHQTRRHAQERTAAFLLNRHGGLLMSNRHGAELIDKGLLIADGRSISFSSPALCAWLQERIARTRRVTNQFDGIAERRESIPGFGTFDLSIAPRLPIGVVPSLFGVHSILTVRPAQSHLTSHAAGVAQDLYRWTLAEFDTVQRLTDGQALPDIARERACSVETVRSHLKNAKRKAGVKRQVELVRLMMSIQGVVVQAPLPIP